MGHRLVALILCLLTLMQTESLGEPNEEYDPPISPDWAFHSLPEVELFADFNGDHATWTNRDSDTPTIPFLHTNGFFVFSVNFSGNVTPSTSSPVSANFSEFSPQSQLYESNIEAVFTTPMASVATSFGSCTSLVIGSQVYDSIALYLGRNHVAPNASVANVKLYRYYVNSKIDENTTQYLFLYPGKYTYLALPINSSTYDKAVFGFSILVNLNDVLGNYSIGDIFDEIVAGDSKYCPENETSRSAFLMSNLSLVTNSSKLGIFPRIPNLSNQVIFIALRTRENTTSIIIPPKFQSDGFFRFTISVNIVAEKDWEFNTEQIVLSSLLIGGAIIFASLTSFCTRKMSKDEMYHPVLTDHDESH